MMMDEADSEQVLEIPEDDGMVSSDDGGQEGEEGETGSGGSEQQASEVDDSVHCFTGHTGTVFIYLGRVSTRLLYALNSVWIYVLQ